MPEQAGGGVKVTLDGAHLRVDARPARLVSLLKGAGGDTLVTAHGASGEGHSQPLPAAARQATFLVRDDVTVEATSAANFVSVADEAGRCVVIAYGGEVTVIPGGDDRFALGSHEALVIGDDGHPSVVAASELSDDAYPELAAMLDAATDALLPAPPAAPDAPDAVTPEPDKPAPVEPVPVKKAAVTPAKAASKSAGGGQRRKKAKKGRPQPAKNATKKSAAGAVTAGAATKATKAGKVTSGGGQAPKTDPPRGGRGGSSGDNEDAHDETSRDKRFLIGAVLVGLAVAVIAVLLLSNTGDDSTDLASGPGASATTTSEAQEATTTTAQASTTTVAAAPKYSIEPKECVQNGSSITYTASVTNEADTALDFEVEVSFTTTDGTEVAKATATVSQLGAGRTADFGATGTSSRNLVGTGARCNVTRVHAQPAR